MILILLLLLAPIALAEPLEVTADREVTFYWRPTGSDQPWQEFGRGIRVRLERQTTSQVDIRIVAYQDLASEWVGERHSIPWVAKECVLTTTRELSVKRLLVIPLVVVALLVLRRSARRKN